jgi:hypothetical protein
VGARRARQYFSYRVTRQRFWYRAARRRIEYLSGSRSCKLLRGNHLRNLRIERKRPNVIKFGVKRSLEAVKHATVSLAKRIAECVLSEASERYGFTAVRLAHIRVVAREVNKSHQIGASVVYWRRMAKSFASSRRVAKSYVAQCASQSVNRPTVAPPCVIQFHDIKCFATKLRYCVGHGIHARGSALDVLGLNQPLPATMRFVPGESSPFSRSLTRRSRPISYGQKSDTRHPVDF